ncbi:hypothetical protein ASG19_13810 [Rhizobium sp. Leaf306]|uniref:hypothetical protein n=1 Tax=Rhizobium sp. Leaf306 TaxID=1736330 RepID=UPI00071337DD|nr:hypothetical protein [Rhizobium sp. Leaf306]KQQ34840.1 hypothetical protein ASG19_13810 [Rhizobium sp. Leaf306]
MFKTTLAASVGVLAFIQVASASSDSAWNAVFAKANGTCIGQSRMVSPEATAPVVFDDAVGKIAILLREKSGKSNKALNLICLYDKKSGKASIAEYQWLGQ